MVGYICSEYMQSIRFRFNLDFPGRDTLLFFLLSAAAKAEDEE